MTRIILVRHGQTEWNHVERFRGRANIPLNLKGLAQAEATGRRIASEWKPSAIYTSPLQRAITTAEMIAIHFDLPVITHPNLIDIDYGQWQGLTPHEVKERWPNMIEDWYKKPASLCIPEGETLTDMRTRGMACVNTLVHRHKNQTIVMVGHTVINRMILLGVLGLGNECFWRLRQDTCAINCFEAEDEIFTLVSLNDTCHLRSGF